MTIDQFKSLPQAIQDDVLGHLLAIFNMLERNQPEQAEKAPEPDTSGIQMSSDLNG